MRTTSRGLGPINSVLGATRCFFQPRRFGGHWPGTAPGHQCDPRHLARTRDRGWCITMTETIDYYWLIRTGVAPVSGRRLRAWDSARPADGVHVLHTMGDTFALSQTLDRRRRPHIGLEMAEGRVPAWSGRHCRRFWPQWTWTLRPMSKVNSSVRRPRADQHDRHRDHPRRARPDRLRPRQR